MNGSPVAALVRGWVDLYTRGMPRELRAARRDEVADDLWCEQEEAAATGRTARALDADRAMRLLLGMPSDLSWRMAYRRRVPPASLGRSGSMSTRILGTLAVVAGSSPVLLAILSIPMGDALLAWGGTWVLVLGSMIAFMVAALGLALQFQDRVGRLGAVGAIPVTLGSIMLLGGSAAGLVLPLGSAMLMRDLARTGGLSRRAAITHLAGAILLIGLAVALLSPTSRALGLVGWVSYMLSWIAIGVSLLRGLPRAQATPG